MSIERLTAWHEFLLQAIRPNSGDRSTYARYWRGKKRREKLLQELKDCQREANLLKESVKAIELAFSALKSMHAQLDDVWMHKKAALTHLGVASEHLLNQKQYLQTRIEELLYKKKQLFQDSEYFPDGWPPSD